MSLATTVAEKEAQQMEPLLRPIGDGNPAGESLRYGPVYDAITEARSAEADLPRGQWLRTEKRADWAQVERLCTDALSKKTKDLQIAVWLAEAWLHLNRLDGLIAGARLLTGLHEGFHRTMYPVETPGEPLSADIVEHRTNLVRTFNTKAALEVRFVQVSAPADSSLPRYTLADLELAKFNDKVQRREQTEEDAPFENPFASFDSADAVTPPSFFVTLAGRVATAAAELQRLDAILDETYGKQNTGLHATKQELEKIARHLTPRARTGGSYGGADADGAETPLIFSENGTANTGYAYDGVAIPTPHRNIPQEETLTAQPIETGSRRGPVNRREAYEQIRTAADFLSRTEPHSPVPYLLRRALRWGSLSLQELLPELLQHPEQLSDKAAMQDRTLARETMQDPYADD